MATPQLPTPVIGNKAYQPRTFQFSQREFGKTSIVKQSFQRQWFDCWFWLHYDIDQDLAFCVIHALLLTKIINSSQLFVWRIILFQQVSRIGKMQLPSLTSTKVADAIKMLYYKHGPSSCNNKINDVSELLFTQLNYSPHAIGLSQVI